MDIFAEYDTASDLPDEFTNFVIARTYAVNIPNEGIYLEVDGGREGPFANEEEAEEFIDNHNSQV